MTVRQKESIDNRMRRVQAFEEVKEGRSCIGRGDLGAAKEWFFRSIQTQPTPEGCTFYAWMLSYEGDLDEAIKWCQQAIELDDEFGNPYNDIGSYMVAKGLLDESIEWFERAKKAKRYESRYFPFSNLGRVYLCKGWLLRARSEFTQALEMVPNHRDLQRLITVLDQELN